MKLLRFVLGCSVVCILLTSCATKQKNLFVLMPDGDGKVGSIVVANKDGSQTLSESRQAVEVNDSHTAPATSFLLEESEIARIFGPALAAQKEFPVWQIFFDRNSTSITKTSQQTLTEIIRAIKNNRSTDIAIAGYTDREGTEQKNYALSLDRAAHIRSILVSRGIDPKFIEINGYGEGMPLIKTEDKIPEPRNRRAEVRVR